MVLQRCKKCLQTNPINHQRLMSSGKYVAIAQNAIYSDFTCDCNQSHYTKVTRLATFMKQKLRFGPVGNTEKILGRL